jgi:lipopolysaccharide export system permease protein
VRILSRYILVRFLAWFAMILAVLGTGVLVAEMLLNLDELIAAADGFRGAIEFLAIKFCAYYLPVLIPIASFAASFLSLGLASRWLEVLAAKAGGISPLRVAVPVLGAAAVLSALTLLVNETLVIGSERAWRHRESGAEGRIEYRRGSFWYHSGNLIYNVGDADPETQTLRDLRVFELSPEGRLVRRIYAGLAQVDARGLHLFDATVFRFDPGSKLEPPKLEWQRELQLDVTALADPALLEAEPATLPLPNLWELITQRSSSGDDVTRFRAMFHNRLSDAPIVFLLALLAVPLGLRVEQTKSMAVPALHGVVLLLAFWSLRSSGQLVAPTHPTAAVAVPWALVLAFAAWGVWRFARIPR